MDTIGPTNSTIMIQQIKRKWKIRHYKLVLYQQYIILLIKKFEMINFNHLLKGRTKWKKLTILEVMFKIYDKMKIQPIKIEIQDVTAYSLGIKKEPDKKSWFYNIIRYIKNQEYQKNIIEKVKKNHQKIII